MGSCSSSAASCDRNFVDVAMPQKKGGFRPILDQFETYDQVQKALHDAGLESSNLIVGLDFTKSNTWTGKRTFGGKSLHAIEPGLENPYQQVIGMMGKTLEAFDDDNLIPVFGFGDIKTADRKVFRIRGSGQDSTCEGFEQVLERYCEVVKETSLSGPTSFAPLIHKAMEIVRQEASYHILVIVADGQVSPECMDDTISAIVEATSLPLSIIMIGVGDGPWHTMEQFDDELPARKFDNFQFVPFYDCMMKNKRSAPAFALEALMEIPDQYNEIQRLGLLKKVRQLSPRHVAMAA